MTSQTRVLELFGRSTAETAGWAPIVRGQRCPFNGGACWKTRKSQSDVAIGSCVVANGADRAPIVICPDRLLLGSQVFTDCLHLLNHSPGNEIHVVSEIAVPGGSIDYFLVSARDGKVVDFVGIEFQALDTTGTVWPERQRFLQSTGLRVAPADVNSRRGFGMNWKMTAKTTLVQLHHKIATLEVLNKHLVLVVQDQLLAYMRREFIFGHVGAAKPADPMHIHSYSLDGQSGALQLAERVSTDSAGVGAALGLQADPRVELDMVVARIQRKMSPATLLSLG